MVLSFAMTNYDRPWVLYDYNREKSYTNAGRNIKDRLDDDLQLPLNMKFEDNNPMCDNYNPHSSVLRRTHIDATLHKFGVSPGGV